MTKNKQDATPRKDLTVEVSSMREEILLFGGVAPNPDKVIATRGHGKSLDLYDELESDAHVKAVISKRKRAGLGKKR